MGPFLEPKIPGNYEFMSGDGSTAGNGAAVDVLEVFQGQIAFVHVQPTLCPPKRSGEDEMS